MATNGMIRVRNLHASAVSPCLWGSCSKDLLWGEPINTDSFSDQSPCFLLQALLDAGSPLQECGCLKGLIQGNQILVWETRRFRPKRTRKSFGRSGAPQALQTAPLIAVQSQKKKVHVMSLTTHSGIKATYTSGLTQGRARAGATDPQQACDAAQLNAGQLVLELGSIEARESEHQTS